MLTKFYFTKSYFEKSLLVLFLYFIVTIQCNYSWRVPLRASQLIYVPPPPSPQQYEGKVYVP